jgi:hypothetical protein
MKHIGDLADSVGLEVTHAPEVGDSGDGHPVPVGDVRCPLERF